jgi:chemotaxis protein CheD
VGVGEMAVSTSARDVLITYSLGSCIGLTVYDPNARVGGLLHAQLPLSTASPGKALDNPAMFVDTGVSRLLERVLSRGASRRSFIVCVAGAASHLDPEGIFAIGRRNYMILRKILWKNDILIHSEDVGGAVSRTLSLDLADGRTVLKAAGSVADMYTPPQPTGGSYDVV